MVYYRPGLFGQDTYYIWRQDMHFVTFGSLKTYVVHVLIDPLSL